MGLLTLSMADTRAGSRYCANQVWFSLLESQSAKSIEGPISLGFQIRCGELYSVEFKNPA